MGDEYGDMYLFFIRLLQFRNFRIGQCLVLCYCRKIVVLENSNQLQVNLYFFFIVRFYDCIYFSDYKDKYVGIVIEKEDYIREFILVI